MISQQEEMQDIIAQAVNTGDLVSAYEALNIYRKTFGEDELVLQYKYLLSDYGPKVSVICLRCGDDEVEEFINSQSYHNLEIVRTSDDDSYSDIIEYMCGTDSRYITFLEPHQICSEDKIADMVWTMDIKPQISVLISVRNIIDMDGTIIAHPDYAYEETFNNVLVKGKMLLEHCISNNVNIYGTLTDVLVPTKYIKTIRWKVPSYDNDLLNRVSVLYQMMLDGIVSYINTPLVSSVVEEYVDDSDIRREYRQLLGDLIPSMSNQYRATYDAVNGRNIYAKDITFFSRDNGEFYNIKPIADEAERRGYKVRYSDDVMENAEIGVYCQHIYYPENSKFSVGLLHDMTQGSDLWPNLWETERWNGFDIGILPGKSWADRWEQCACIKYTKPRYGTYQLGYPKSDIVNNVELKQRAEELRKQLGLKQDISVLYAPSWEYAGKEDDFIKAVAPLNVNMLIKQAHWFKEEYQQIVDNERNKHEGKYENLYYIDVKESIMTALELCDIVVSDESNVMTEALMFDKPSIAVMDWLIPDTEPARFSHVPMDYVFKCKKADLRDTVNEYINDSNRFDKMIERGRLTFSNAGHVCSDILDAIDYYTQNGSETGFMNKKLKSKYREFDMWN